MAKSNPNILVVDDEVNLATSIANWLNKENSKFSAEAVFDSYQALDYIAKKETDVLVTDIMMPGMSGIDLLLRVRTEHPEIDVIIMTAYGTKELFDKAINGGATNYVKKPFDLAQLKGLIDQTLEARAGFNGQIVQVKLTEIIQMIGLSGNKLALEIKNGNEKAIIYFDVGKVIHAECKGLKGPQAFKEILKWSGGSFNPVPNKEPSEQSINQRWENLLLDSMVDSDTPQEKEEDDLVKDLLEGVGQLVSIDEVNPTKLKGGENMIPLDTFKIAHDLIVEKIGPAGELAFKAVKSKFFKNTDMLPKDQLLTFVEELAVYITDEHVKKQFVATVVNEVQKNLPDLFKEATAKELIPAETLNIISTQLTEILGPAGALVYNEIKAKYVTEGVGLPKDKLGPMLEEIGEYIKNKGQRKKFITAIIDEIEKLLPTVSPLYDKAQNSISFEAFSFAHDLLVDEIGPAGNLAFKELMSKYGKGAQTLSVEQLHDFIQEAANYIADKNARKKYITRFAEGIRKILPEEKAPTPIEKKLISLDALNIAHHAIMNEVGPAGDLAFKEILPNFAQKGKGIYSTQLREFVAELAKFIPGEEEKEKFVNRITNEILKRVESTDDIVTDYVPGGLI